MNRMELEAGIEYHGQALYNETRTITLLERAGLRSRGVSSRVLLFIAQIMIAIGTRIRDWYGSAPTGGYLPNLHID